jgi:hypothetical protein
MSRKLLKKDYFILKQELLITPVPKFGKTNHMIINLMFGV